MDKQKDKPLYVAFSTQKGGAGKTTLTVLVASYLHYVKGYDVAVIDCDFPQYSIHRNLFLFTVIILIIGVLTREERRFTVLVHYPQIRYIRSRGDNDCGKNTVHGLSWEWEDEGGVSYNRRK